MSRSQEAEIAENAAIAGARAMITEIQSGRLVSANRKDDFTYVLNLDLMSEATIKKALPTSYQVVSEEQPDSHALLATERDYFLVDPLDGTNNCRRALSYFGNILHPMHESFGPLVGFVKDGVIQNATFVSLSESLVWSAERRKGCTVTPLSDDLPEFTKRDKVLTVQAPRLRECSVLFYPGKRGEIDLLNKLRSNDLVDGCFRYGGFAGDCTRIARAREQILIQFSLKPWDLVAGLLATESGSVALGYDGTDLKRLDSFVAHPLEKIVIANAGCVEELIKAIKS